MPRAASVGRRLSDVVRTYEPNPQFIAVGQDAPFLWLATFNAVDCHSGHVITFDVNVPSSLGDDTRVVFETKVGSMPCPSHKSVGSGS